MEKLAKEPSFKPNDLIECIFEEEEIDEDETKPEEFSDRDFEKTEEILRTIRKDFENKESVMYIVG